MTNFSPKNLTFLPIKFDRVVPDTLQWYQIDHRTSADPGGQLTQKFGVTYERGPSHCALVGIWFNVPIYNNKINGVFEEIPIFGPMCSGQSTKVVRVVKSFFYNNCTLHEYLS